MKRAPLLVLGLLLPLAPAASAVDFESDILPIFAARCDNCHMDGSSKGGITLDLDKIDREIGPTKTIVPGDAAKSELYELVSLPPDDRDVMPPKGKGRPLSSNELKLLKDWIDEGASIGGEEEMVADAGDEPAMAAPPAPLAGAWSNREGAVIQATLIRVDGDKAVLKMANGQEYPYPIQDLSDESQAKVREWAGTDG